MIKYLPVIMLVTGCTSTRDKQLFSIGAIVFCLYLAGMIITFLVPAIHHNRILKNTIDRAKPLALILAKVLIVIGAVILTGSIIIYEQSMTFKLVPILGGVIIITGQCLKLWSNNNNQKQTVYAKAIAISIGCIIGLTYIISGANNLKF